MSTMHTPGRIYFRANGDANSYALFDQSTNNWRMSFIMNGEATCARQVADIERMAACWSACDGVPTDALEQIEGFGKAALPYHQLKSQHNELLEAAGKLLASFPTHATHRNHAERRSYEELRTAIAKATGKKGGE